MISIICANDSMELAFPSGTQDDVIEQHRLRIKGEMDKRYPDSLVYVHVHTVEEYTE